jgi:type IV secretory pathway VirB4 component
VTIKLHGPACKFNSKVFASSLQNKDFQHTEPLLLTTLQHLQSQLIFHEASQALNKTQILTSRSFVPSRLRVTPKTQ